MLVELNLGAENSTDVMELIGYHSVPGQSVPVDVFSTEMGTEENGEWGQEPFQEPQGMVVLFHAKNT